jgi:hypothetical protein
MALIGIIYDDRNASTYEAVEVSESFTDKKYLFSSGDFPSDWFNAKKLYITKLQDQEPFFSGLSSCDHFFFDGAGELYDSAWLVMDGENPTLTYEYTEKGWEMFVHKNTRPTWGELKAEANKRWPQSIEL